MSTLDATYTGVKRGSGAPDRAVLLAHGAGADKDTPALAAISEALRDVGIPSMRFNFPYRAAGRNAPDRAPVLQESLRRAATALAKRAKVPADRLVVGGRSMGGRMASLCVTDRYEPLPALGLALLAYPLHPPGKPDVLRTEHLPEIIVPTLFISGTRDAFGTRAELTKAAKKVAGPVTMHWLDTADHGYRPLKSGGRTQEAVLDDVAATVVDWVQRLT